MKLYLFLIAAILSEAALAVTVRMETTMGTMVIDVDEERAPITSENFLTYIEDGFYDNVVFHRVIEDFVIQGGGWTRVDDELVLKETRDPIINESTNGLSNLRGTIGMARTSDPNSATSQFFINHVDNTRLDYVSADQPGYAVFGQLVAGFEVLDAIAAVATGDEDRPVDDVTILSVVIER